MQDEDFIPDRERPASPLRAEDRTLPADIRRHLIQAQSSWLSNTAVVALLKNFQHATWDVRRSPPDKPPGGTLFLYDRKVVRFFRKDSHVWRKKSDGKTVRETHEKLKIDNQDLLNCYYAHPQNEDSPQRRCYWLLDSAEDIVLVHYLVAKPRGSGGSNPDHTRRSYSPGGSSETSQEVSYDEESPHEVSTESQTMNPFMDQTELNDLAAHSSIDALNLELRSTSLDGYMPQFENQGAAAQGLRRRSEDEGSDSLLPSLPDLMPLPSAAMMLPILEEPAVPLQEYDPSGRFLKSSLALANPRCSSSRAGEQPDLSLQWMPGTFVKRPHNMDPNGSKVEPRNTMEQCFTHLRHNRSPPALEAIASTEAYHRGLSESMDVSPQLQEASQEQVAGELQMEHLPIMSMPLAAYSSPQLQSQAFNSRSRPMSQHYDTAGSRVSMQTHPSYPCVEYPDCIPMEAAETRGPLPILPLRFKAKQSRPALDVPPARAAHRTKTAPGAQSPKTPTLAGKRKGKTTGLAHGGIAKISDREKSRTSGNRIHWARRVVSDAGDMRQRATSIPSAFHGAKAAGKVELSAFADYARSYADYDNSPDLDEEQDRKRMISARSLSRMKSAPNPMSDGSLLSEVSERESQDWGCSPTPMQFPGGMFSVHEPPFLLHEDYAPNWDTTEGGAKMILTCTCSIPSRARLHVCFGRKEVLAAKISPGIENISPCVIKVRVPPNYPGTTNIFLTFGDGRPLSNILPFHYEDAPRMPQKYRDWTESNIPGSFKNLVAWQL